MRSENKQKPYISKKRKVKRREEIKRTNKKPKPNMQDTNIRFRLIDLSNLLNYYFETLLSLYKFYLLAKLNHAQSNSTLMQMQY